MLEYSVVEKEQFTVIGRVRRFEMQTAYTEIPKFWQEHMSGDERKTVCGMYGICFDGDDKAFDYMIADDYLDGREIPQGYVTRVIPAGSWAVFPCRGALPKALQDVNTRIWNEWLPACREYRLSGRYNIEMYTPSAADPNDDYTEIWVPVERL